MATAGAFNRYCQLQKINPVVQVDSHPGGGFRCRITLQGIAHVGYGRATNKKAAQANAVANIVQFLESNGELGVLDSTPAYKKRKVTSSGSQPSFAQAAGAGASAEETAEADAGFGEAEQELPAPRQGGLISSMVAAAGGAPPSKIPLPRPNVVGSTPALRPRLGSTPIRPRGPTPQWQPAGAPGRPPFTPGIAPVKALAPRPAVSQDDGIGGFTPENARGLVAQQIKKWGQTFDPKITQSGPPHNPVFWATYSCWVKPRHVQITETHQHKNKKDLVKELSLNLARRLFQMNALPKFSRSISKSTLSESFQQTKYYEAGSLSIELTPAMKQWLGDYLGRKGCAPPRAGALVPGAVLLSEQDRKTPAGSQSAGVDIGWSPPGSPTWKPWPKPKWRGNFRGSSGALAPAQASAELPVMSHRHEIMQAVSEHQVCIIMGATGSGKTTQVPQFLLDAEDGQLKSIVVVQPRRLAAITVARRVAAERGEQLGGSVGYAVRFDSVWPEQVGGICYMTTGLFLKRLHQRGLHGISHVIVDEVHERELHTDLLLSMLKQATQYYENLRIVLMSATIDGSRFQEYMTPTMGSNRGSIPRVIQIEGQCHPVQLYFLEDTIELLQWSPSGMAKAAASGDSLNTCSDEYEESTRRALANLPEQQIPLELAKEIIRAHVGSEESDAGSVLVFLPTWAMMSLLQRLLTQEHELSSKCRIIMLHSQVSRAEQLEAFKPPPAGMKKVILATNIAESSITIDDVSVVIDSCCVKVTFASETTGLSHNQIVWTGRYNLQQRMGRAGRTRPGVCFRLITRRRFAEGLEDEIPPELTRAPLAESSLLVKSLGFGDASYVLRQCMDAPPEEAIEQALRELRLVRALDDQERLTPLGRALARLPVSPHIGLALLMGHWLFGIGDIMATLCAAMSFDEPFPFEKTAGYLPWSIQEKFAGNRKHSDQFLLGLVHQQYAHLRSTAGERAAQEFCDRENLHPVIMQQVFDATNQLRQLLASTTLSGAMEEPGAGDEDETTGTIPPHDPQLIRDWAPRDWQWGAVQLLLATALPALALHHEKRHLWLSETVVGAVHKGSLNCTKTAYVYPSPIFAFLEQVKEGGWKPPRCRQITILQPSVALMRPFAPGSIVVDPNSSNVVTVGGFVPLGPVDPASALLLIALRQHLENVVVQCAEAKAAAGASGTKRPFEHQELVGLMKQLLGPDRMRWR